MTCVYAYGNNTRCIQISTPEHQTHPLQRAIVPQIRNGACGTCYLNSVYAVARRNKSCQKIPKTMKFYQTGWSHGANRRVVRYNLPTDMLVFFIIGAEKNRPFADGEKHCAVIPGLYIRGAHKRFLCEAQGSMLYWIGYNIQLHS